MLTTPATRRARRSTCPGPRKIPFAPFGRLAKSTLCSPACRYARVSPAGTASRSLKQICDRVTLVSLTPEEYLSAIESVSTTIVGGAAYDALIARCAVKAEAEVLFTWNVRDFTRFGPEVARLVKTPLEFQRIS